MLKHKCSGKPKTRRWCCNCSSKLLQVWEVFMAILTMHRFVEFCFVGFFLLLFCINFSGKWKYWFLFSWSRVLVFKILFIIGGDRISLKSYFLKKLGQKSICESYEYFLYVWSKFSYECFVILELFSSSFFLGVGKWMVL
jgi:hypothetical protein